MSEYVITATGEDRGHSVMYPVIVRSVRGVHASYGPAGFGIGIIPAGREGRRANGAAMEAGPWGYLYGRASVIDTRGGSGRELSERAAQGLVIEEVGAGDVLVIEGTRYVVRITRDYGIALDPDNTPVTAGTSLAAFDVTVAFTVTASSYTLARALVEQHLADLVRYGDLAFQDRFPFDSWHVVTEPEDTGGCAAREAEHWPDGNGTCGYCGADWERPQGAEDAHLEADYEDRTMLADDGLAY